MSVNMKQSGALVPIASLTKAIIPLGTGDCYSTEERQVGCFVDGKPVYQITLIKQPTALVEDIDVSSLNIDRLIDREGCLTRTISSTNIQQKKIENRTETPSNNQYGIMADLRGTNLHIVISGYTYTEITEIRCTLQYTKTTDTAGSGIWTPNGGQALHFSTSEQIIGTWIDGRTIYEKTIDFGALPANTQKNVNHGISNFDLIIEIIATATRPASQGTHTAISIPSTHWESISNQNEMSVNDTSIMIRNHNSSFSAWTQAYVTLRYVKTSS